MSNEPPVFTAADRAEVKRARAKAAASAAAAEAAYAAWEKEKPDPAATSSLHDYVIASMRELDTQGELDEVACRETLCRANVHFESVGDALKYEDEAGMQELRKSIKVSLRDQGVDVEVMLARGDRAKPGAGETRVMTERAAASAPSPPPSSAH